jgi:hypothetical protein
MSSSKPPPTEETKGEAKATPSLLASARDLVFILAILAFFAGFEYRYYYYSYLHIPIATFSIADNQIVAGSYSVFLSHRWYILLGFGILVALALTSDLIKVPDKSYKYQRLALLFVLLAFFPILNTWAQQTAGLVFTGLINTPTGTPRKPIIITSLKDSGPWSASIRSAMQTGCVELITQSSDTFYVLVRQRVRPYVYVAAIPSRAVAHWIIPLDYPGGNYAKRCIPN